MTLEPPPPSVGVFGKLPSVGDFVVRGANSQVGRALQSFIHEEVAALMRKHQRWPDKPLRFVFRDAAGAGVLVGVIVPSRDAVGREFPVACFAEVLPDAALASLPWLPSTFAAWLDRALATLGAETEPARLFAACDDLGLPGAHDYDEARVWAAAALEATPGSAMLEALFGPLEKRGYLHGVHMFRSACDRFRARDPGRASIVLDCPTTDDVQLVFWLALARLLLQWLHAPPTLFWNDAAGRDSRMLLSLGAPPPGTVSFLADPTATAERLWPMRTQDTRLLDTARTALEADVLAGLEPPAATAALLLEALVR